MNRRPSGYEPDELPTAPLRDFVGANVLSPEENKQAFLKKNKQTCLAGYFYRKNGGGGGFSYLGGILIMGQNVILILL